MPKVCVLEMTSYCDSCGCESMCNTRDGTEWEEVTQEELQALENYAKSSLASYSRTGKYLVVVKQVQREDWERSVADYLEKAKEQLAKDEEKFMRKLQAQKEKERKDEEKKKAKDLQKLEELKKKYGMEGGY